MTTRLTAEQWSGIVSHLDEEVKIKVIAPNHSVLRGKIIQSQTAGSRKIEEAALTHSGGGNIAVGSDMMAVENFFQVIVEITDERLDQDRDALKIGMSAVLALPSNHETIASLVYRRSMRLLSHSV